MPIPARELRRQLEIKKEILRETLRRTAKLERSSEEIEVHASPPWNYRNRSRLQVQVSPTFTAGYFKLASHDLLAVEECPISSPLINRGITMLWRNGRAGKVPQGVREVEFFSSADDTRLLLELGCAAEARRRLGAGFGRRLARSPPRNRRSDGVPRWRPRRARRENSSTVAVDRLTYHARRAAYRVSAGSFFQTNRYLTDELVRIITQGQSGELALDLYAGVGLFSTALACDFHHVVSVESSQTSSRDLSYNQPSNGKAVQATTEQYLARAENGRVGKGAVLPHIPYKPDLAVVDPPRSGLQNLWRVC